jgi:DNA-binding response OmpR family regulator
MVDRAYDVLVVDNDDPTIELISAYMEFKNARCKGVHQGSGVIDEVLKARPGVVILDVELADVDGFDVCKRIKEDSRMHSTRVYITHCAPERSIINDLASCKADGFLEKPFDLSALDEILWKYRFVYLTKDEVINGT